MDICVQFVTAWTPFRCLDPSFFIFFYKENNQEQALKPRRKVEPYVLAWWYTCLHKPSTHCLHGSWLLCAGYPKNRGLATIRRTETSVQDYEERLELNSTKLLCWWSKWAISLSFTDHYFSNTKMTYTLEEWASIISCNISPLGMSSLSIL